MCWRKCQRFVIVSPWCTQFHLAVSVNMITGIKHRQPRHPRELQLTAELHGVISQLYRSPLRSSAIVPTPVLHPPPDPRIPTSRGRHCHRHRSSVARKVQRAGMQNRVFASEDGSFECNCRAARMTRVTIDFFFFLFFFCANFAERAGLAGRSGSTKLDRNQLSRPRRGRLSTSHLRVKSASNERETDIWSKNRGKFGGMPKSGGLVVTGSEEGSRVALDPFPPWPSPSHLGLIMPHSRLPSPAPGPAVNTR